MRKYILIGSVAPLLRALTNYIDKFLLQGVSYSHKHIIPTLIIFSGLAGLLPVIVLLFGGGYEFFLLPVSSILITLLSGCIYVMASYFFLRALDLDDAANIVPYFQIMPVFALIAGHIFFDEVMTSWGVVGVFLVCLGSFLLGFRIKTYTFHHQPFLLMMLSSLLFFSTDGLFKYALMGADFASSGVGVGLGIFSVSIGFLMVPQYRQAFLDTVHKQGNRILSTNIINEMINMFAKFLFLSLVPYLMITHLELISSLQPLFIVGIGFLLYTYGYKDYRKPTDATRQILSISIMILGVFLISSSL